MISRVVLADLPCTIGGYCVTNADGEKICVLNAKHSFEGNKKNTPARARACSEQ